MSNKFKQLLLPEGYRHYWSKYPEGYTILEALLNWVESVNQLTDNVNDWNIYLDDFVENFDEKLRPTVREMLHEMEQDGRLAEIINEDIFNELNTRMEERVTQTTTLEIGANADNTTDDSEILNNFLSAGEDRFLFFNQGQYLTENTVLVDQPNTIIKGNGFARGWIPERLRKSAIFADHIDDIMYLRVPSSENATYIENISLYGNDKARNGLVVGLNEFQGTTINNVHVMNVLDTAFVLEGNNYATYYNDLFSTNSPNGISIRQGNSHNIVFRGCHHYGSGTVLDILTDFDSEANTSKMIVFDSCDFSNNSYTGIEQLLVHTGKCTNVVFNNCYFESAQPQIKDYIMEFGTLTGGTRHIKFENCHFAGANYNYFAKLTNVRFLTIENCYFESTPMKAWFKASTDTTDTVSQQMQGSLINQVFTTSIPLIGTDDGRVPLPDEFAFYNINNTSGYGGVHQRGGFKASTNNPNNFIYRGYDSDQVTYPSPYFEIRKNALYFGDGKTTPLTGFNIDEGYPNFNSGLKTGNSYTSAMRFGNVYMWANPGTQHLMYKRGSAPTSNTDGTQLTT